MVQYSTKMIFAVLDVSLFMGLNIGETDKAFYINNNNNRQWSLKLKADQLRTSKTMNKISVA